MLVTASAVHGQDYQDYGQEPIAEPSPDNDILPPADDGLADALTKLDPGIRSRPAPEVFAPSNLRVASWDLSEAPNLMPPPQTASAQARSWRTTFGSERRTEAEATPVPVTQALDVDADVMLLQGVSDVSALRRLFQPRHWRLVVSRRVLPSGDPSAVFAGPSLNTALPVRVTAIAVRAKRGLRIVGREHIVDLASAEDGAGSATAPSATVVRIADGTRMLWLVSVVLPETCRSERGECPARQRISEWQKTKQSAGQATVIGGRFAGGVPGAPSPLACSQQAIESDLRQSGQSPHSQGLARHGAGCVALVELPAK
jgi:hypothetical protein